jgi:hypothetical protein
MRRAASPRCTCACPHQGGPLQAKSVTSCDTARLLIANFSYSQMSAGAKKVTIHKRIS